MAEKKKLWEVSVRYTDGSDELLLLTGDDYQDAEVEAEAWVDYKKTVLDITAVKEVERRRK